MFYFYFYFNKTECPNNITNDRLLPGINITQKSCSELTGYLYSIYDYSFTIKNLCVDPNSPFANKCCLKCLGILTFIRYNKKF